MLLLFCVSKKQKNLEVKLLCQFLQEFRGQYTALWAGIELAQQSSHSVMIVWFKLCSGNWSCVNNWSYFNFSRFQDNGNNVTDLGGFTFLSKQLIVEGSQFSHFMMRLKCLSACLRVLKPQCYLSLLPNVCFAKLCQPPTAADCLASVFRRDTWVLILLTIMHHAASDTSKSPHCHSISAVVSKSDSNILDINCDTFLFLHFHSRNWGCGHFYHQSPVVTINYMQQAWYSHMM